MDIGLFSESLSTCCNLIVHKNGSTLCLASSRIIFVELQISPAPVMHPPPYSCYKAQTSPICIYLGDLPLNMLRDHVDVLRMQCFRLHSTPACFN